MKRWDGTERRRVREHSHPDGGMVIIVYGAFAVCGVIVGWCLHGLFG